MKNIFKIICALACLSVMSTAQQVGITGTIQSIDKTGWNGFLRIRLQGSNIKNICTTPFKPVPTLSVQYPIVNGIAIGLNTGSFLSQDCMTPRIPYYVEISDTNSIVQGSNNWYLPRAITGTVDIGAMQAQHFGGPITVAIPYGIIGTPSSNQVITQPTGTSLTINGAVHFTGTTIFDTPPSFAVLTPTQILVGGITSSTFPLDVQGGINTSGGYYYGGTGGVAGQCIVSDGTSGKWGTCSVPFPTLYYQTIAANGTNQTQQGTLNFSSNFVLSNTAGNTNVELKSVGTPNTYNNVSGLTTDAFGRVTAVTTYATSNARVCNGFGCYVQNGDGTIFAWGTVIAPSSGGTLVTTTISFPISFTSTPSLTVSGGNNPTGFDDAMTVYYRGLSIGGATAVVRCALNIGGSGCGSIPNAVPVTWIAIGY